MADEQARQRAACVRAYRRWQANRRPISVRELVAQLQAKHPGLGVNYKNLHNWDRRTGAFVRADRLRDCRGGDQKGPGAQVRRWWRERRRSIQVPCDVARELERTAAGRKLQHARQRYRCVHALVRFREETPGRLSKHLPHLIGELRRAFPGLPISQTSLYRWSRNLHLSGAAALVDRRGGYTARLARGVDTGTQRRREADSL